MIALPNTKVLLIAAILAGCYFLCLHPFSGVLGGFIFLFIGGWIPSVVNVIFSYWLSCYIIKTNNTLRWLLCFVISLLLGLNILLLNHFFYQSSHVEVKIIKPLHKIVNPIGILYVDESAGNINPFFINLYSIEGNEGCGCMYFKSIQSIYNNSSVIHFIEKMLHINASRTLWSTGGREVADYMIFTKMSSENKFVRFTLTIQDKLGGSVDINTNYPIMYFMPKPLYYRFPDQEHFWKHAFTVFIYNNFWYALLHQQLEVKNIFDLLSPSQRQALFNEANEA